LPSVAGLLRFRSSYNKKETVNIDGVEIYFISYEDLITSKKENARQKDIDDIEQLKTKRDNPEESK
jgi:predicted nucleotidyltransferase